MRPRQFSIVRFLLCWAIGLIPTVALYAFKIIPLWSPLAVLGSYLGIILHDILFPLPDEFPLPKELHLAYFHPEKKNGFDWDTALKRAKDYANPEAQYSKSGNEIDRCMYRYEDILDYLRKHYDLVSS